jgi:hypothetical protein
MMLSHLTTGMPAGSISSLVEDMDEVDQVEQLFPSFEGLPVEVDEALFTRISERLQHKDRMVNSWDFERIVLNEFPEVFRVKCLMNTDSKLNPHPGKVLVLVIPNLIKTKNKTTFKPKIPSYKLAEIQKFVKTKVSGLVDVEVVNPSYEEIQVKFHVRYHEGVDARHFLNVLNEDLKSFFSPWINKGSKQLDITESIKGASVLYFLETREYIDIITNFSVNHIIDNRIRTYSNVNFEEIEIMPSSPVSIFTSSQHHLINILDNEDAVDYGINEMAIETDLIVDDEKLFLDKKVKGIDKMSVSVDFEIDYEDEKPTEKENFVLRLK